MVGSISPDAGVSAPKPAFGTAGPGAGRVHFEDFSPGTIFRSGATLVTRAEILEFAREWDAQPFHVDEQAAKETFVGELIGSGWHSCALMMRMLCEALVLNSSSMGAGGVEEVRWLRPVRPGDTLRLELEVLETRQPRTRPDRGFVHCRIVLLNQRDEAVLTQVFWGMFGRRQPGLAEIPPPETRASAEFPKAPASESPASEPNATASPDLFAPYFEDVVVGERRRTGEHTFDPEGIIRFARAYDPQPFHLSEEAARNSHFGRLCASGWHTGAAWMRSMVLYRQRMRAEAAAAGQPFGEFGASPGFKDLKWVKPVYAGDTITFASKPVAKRESASRSGWGLVFSHNTGDNQHGERVFEFTGSVFWQRRPA